MNGGEAKEERKNNGTMTNEDIKILSEGTISDLAYSLEMAVAEMEEHYGRECLSQASYIEMSALSAMFQREYERRKEVRIDPKMMCKPLSERR